MVIVTPKAAPGASPAADGYAGAAGGGASGATVDSEGLGHAIPNTAEPTRTEVAPKAIAVSKSALMPIDSSLRPFRSAIFFRSAKWGKAGSSAGGMHINPWTVRP